MQNTKPFYASKFIAEAKLIHGNKYSYELVTDSPRSSYYKIDIICYEHGRFRQEAGYHLKGSGCPRCARQKINNSISRKFIASEFIEKAKRIHGEFFDYSLVNDADRSTHLKVDLICPLHGKFSISAKDHLGKRGGRCPRCSKKESYGEFLIRKCLTDLVIDFEIQKKFDDLRDRDSNRRLSFDFYIPKVKCLIEFDGEYHFHPPHFNKKVSLEEVRRKIKERDEQKDEYAKSKNLKLIRISYLDRNPQKILEIISEIYGHS